MDDISFGRDIATFVDLCFTRVAKQYTAENYLIATNAKKLLQTHKSLQQIRKHGREPSKRIDSSTARFLEHLADLDAARRRLEWLADVGTETFGDIGEVELGHAAYFVHDSIFVYGQALVEKASVAGLTAISRFIRPGTTEKSKLKKKYSKIFDQMRKGIAEKRDPIIHGVGRGGVDRPDIAILTDNGWWEWMLATGAWQAWQTSDLIYTKAAVAMNEWAEKLRPAVEGTANKVGEEIMNSWKEISSK